LISLLVGCALFPEATLRPPQPIPVAPAVPTPKPRPVIIAIPLPRSKPAIAEPVLVRPAKPFAFMPPRQYDDRDYEGTLTIKRADKSQMDQWCPTPSAGMVSLGCVPYRSPSECRVVIAADDLLAAAKYSFAIVLKHELAHCLGWPSSHPGARVPDQNDWAMQ
jgi:hypothetical protein